MADTIKLQKHYDHVIVGYNLASLTFAYELFKKQQNFCLLDARHLSGSQVKQIDSVEGLVRARVPFNQRLPEGMFGTSDFGEITHREGTPLTFDKGSFKSFLGFGSEKVECLDAVDPYLVTTHDHPQRQVEDFWQQVLTEVEPSFFLDQEVTDLQYDEEGITSLTLNAKTTLRGRQFYFFDQFPFVFEKLGNEMKKAASQFAKTKWYSSVNLVLSHETEPATYELDQLYLLMGSKNQPCLGQFSRINGHLVSRWESFIPAEMTVDSETTGATYKEIKKQVRRAFATDHQLPATEHVLIHDRVFADFSRTRLKNGKVTHFNNLEVHSPLFNHAVGWAHEILCGLQAAANLKDAPQPLEPEPENSSHSASL
jgi:hypothetical protein